jgi:Dolichyl-phosphate-mannose-protein mannosyltransferase
MPRPPPARLASLAPLYARCLRGADVLHRHRRAAGLLGAPLVTLALVAINQLVLLDFPNSADEYVYLYQARMLAAGHLSTATVASPELFAFNYIVQEPARTFGSFPLGWPLALALALALRVPAWLVNPALGALTLGLVWTLGARLYSPRIGVLAAALVAASPFFAFTAASYFSHTFCGVLLLGAACLAARDDRTPAWVPVAIGLLVGWAVLTRYLTGVVCAVPILLWLCRPGVRRGRLAALVVLGGLPWIAVLMAYNTALSGGPWQLTMTPLTASRWFAEGVMLRGADILATQLVRYVLWTPPALVVAYLVYLRSAGDTRRGLIQWLPVLMAGILYCYVERGGNQYGPRFHYETFPFLALFVAANVFRADEFGANARRDQGLFALVAVSVALMPLAFTAHAVVERQVIRERMDPYRMAAAAGLQQALVLIGGRVGTARSMAAFDLTRNDLAHESSVLYGLDAGAPAHCAPGVRIAGRTTYLYAWNLATSRGVLRRLQCP